jgi:hypothetical protein
MDQASEAGAEAAAPSVPVPFRAEGPRRVGIADGSTDPAAAGGGAAAAAGGGAGGSAGGSAERSLL